MVTNAIAVRLSRTEIAIELMATELFNTMKIWEVREAARGEVKCTMDTRMKFLGCFDMKAVRGRYNFAAYEL